MRVMVEVLPEEPGGGSLAMAAEFEEAPVHLGALADTGFEVDEEYPAMVLPGAGGADGGDLARFALTAEPSFHPADVSALVRGVIPDGAEGEEVVASLSGRDQVKGVFSDPVIAPFVTCAGDPAVGTAEDVAQVLGCDELLEHGFDGSGVSVAVVDTGINLERVTAAGHHNPLDAFSGFTPLGVLGLSGQHPVDHGSMCAFDVGIAAPEATLLDHAVLLSKTKGNSAMEGLLSDAVRSFSMLRAKLESMPQEGRALVISNSWGLYSPTWDFPTDHPSNYTDNPRHPFNLIVSSLEAAGADILFAAGNCGVECPVDRCGFSERPIVGANSHPDVISVAGVTVRQERVGYSSQGPGRLAKGKPDLAAYTHFFGSGVYPTDSGTSAACPVLAGVVAAIRTRFTASQLTPVQLRSLLFRTATDVGGLGFDYDNGWGIVEPPKMVQALA
jgi:subtilisin family serine protease